MLKAQSDNIKKIFPTSPEMSGLVKRVDIPLNYSSGAINYSLNLYTLKTKNLEIPINLNYTATGFKPSENSSNIGLGWDIEIGGKISHNVQGLDDLYPNSSLYTYIPEGLPVDKPFKVDFRNLIYTSAAYNTPEYYFLRMSSPSSYLEKGGEFVSNWNFSTDTQPDIFYFSYPGKSSKFFLDKDYNGRQMPFGKEKIKYENNKFIIVDITGNKYEYSVKDIIQLESGTQILSGSYPSGSSTSYYNNFYLTKIDDVDGNTIDFIYDFVEYSYDNPTSYVKGVSKDFRLPKFYTQNYEIKNISSVTKHTLPILKTIKVNGIDKITFNYNSIPRTDVKNIYSKKISSLTNITIKEAGKTKNIVFNQSYFNSEISSQNSINSWLKLDKILIDDQTFSFEYYNGNLPLKDTEAKDLWGYFNNQNNIRFYKGNFKETFYLGTGREPDENFSKLTLLKKIIYPTKGSDEIFYEGNEYSEPNYKEFTTVDQIVGVYYNSETSDNGEFNESQSFTLDNKTKVNLRYLIYLDTGGETTSKYLRYSLRNNTTNMYVDLTSLSGLGDQDIDLEIGNYTLNLTAKGIDYEPFLQVQWQENIKTYDGHKNLKVGGIRLSKIITRDYNDDVKITKIIDYRNNGISTGRLYNYPIFYELEKLNYFFYVMGENCPNSSGVTFQKYYSNSINDIMGYNGNTVFYENVSEKLLDKNNSDKGRTSYTFLNNEDEPLYYDEKPFIMFNDNSWKRGLLEKQETYNSTDIYPIKTITNHYTFLNSPTRYLDDSGLDYSTPTFPNEFHMMSYQFYTESPEYDAATCVSLDGMTQPIAKFKYIGKKLKSAQVYKDKEVIEERFNNSISNTEINYKYENPFHGQITRKIVSFLDSTIQETTYQYAHDKGNQKMIDANMVGIPLETVTIKNGKAISKVETVYPTILPTTQTGNLLLPLSVHSTRTNTISVSVPPVGEVKDIEVTYDKYDDKGNILQYTEKGLKPTVIIWGYNQTQPIVKIEGISYDALMALSGVSTLLNYAITKSNSDVNTATEQLLITALDNLRTDSSLNAYMISTYTYDPLIGVTSITPPSGIREIYKYDSANRLQSVVDVNGKILKEYQYNYKQ